MSQRSEVRVPHGVGDAKHCFLMGGWPGWKGRSGEPTSGEQAPGGVGLGRWEA